uniref:Helicase ATP-binding domain-containing protein n=1 Tax=Pyramimonas orientalis virus TaxID=455367 RepID=A0A7M3UNR9_POV01|nr:hypothetical protein HWQ62_00211 [Pyramimonas orientalis virus]
MNTNNGYIYVRYHTSYDALCKLGKTGNIIERDCVYATGEPIRGTFESVFEVELKHMGFYENLLKYQFQHLNVIYDGGTEFFKKEIIYQIEPYLTSMNLSYRKLSSSEIDNIKRIVRLKLLKKKIIRLLLLLKKSPNTLTPRPDQEEIIQNSILHFKQYEKGMLVLMCGMGKTLISLWVAQRMNVKTLVVGVPNLLLVRQWYNDVKLLFPKHLVLLVKEGNITEGDIERFVSTHSKHVVITTYASSHKVKNATNRCGFNFDMKINDEAHHLTSVVNDQEKKTNCRMLEIASKKQLSLTATLKVLGEKNDEIISNDNLVHFGEIIERKSLLWSINLGVICDYEIQTITTDDTINDYDSYLFKDDNDKRMFMSAITSLKSISSGNTHHLLVYANNLQNTQILMQHIEHLLNTEFKHLKEKLYYSGYDSTLNNRQQEQAIEQFRKSKYGIITCVYCLGEGWDFPILDGVVFSEKMTSNIRIVQSALRASRLNKFQPNKKAKIILPIIVHKNVECVEQLVKDTSGSKDDMKTVKEVIYHMGLEDETICQKIKLFKIKLNDTTKTYVGEDNNCGNEEIGQYDKELTDHLLLNTVRRCGLGVGFEKAKRILKEKLLRSKEAYYELCKKDVRFAREPEVFYKNQFTNWVDYLGIERVYYDKDTCIKKVQEYIEPRLKLNISLICENACLNDKMFPPFGLWVDYYNVNTLEELVMVKSKKKCNRIFKK